MAYSDTVAGLKKALKGYSDAEESITALYKAARENADAEHSRATEKLERNYNKDRNTAYSDMMREEKNLFQLLAARGLGFSGEVAQTKLNTGINLGNTLASLSSAKTDADAALEKTLADTKSKLDFAEAEEKAELTDKRNTLSAEIADVEAKAASAAKQEGNGDDGGDTGDTGDTGGYIPTVSPKELASQILKSVTEGKYGVSDASQNDKIDTYLFKLEDGYGIDKTYMKNLIFCLMGYGYVNRTYEERRIGVIAETASEYYDTEFDKYYAIYKRSSLNSEVSARRKARDTAFELQMVYIYTRCNSIDEFKACCNRMEISDADVNAFIKMVNKANTDGTKFVLGSENI